MLIALNCYAHGIIVCGWAAATIFSIRRAPFYKLLLTYSLKHYTRDALDTFSIVFNYDNSTLLSHNARLD